LANGSHAANSARKQTRIEGIDLSYNSEREVTRDVRGKKSGVITFSLFNYR